MAVLVREPDVVLRVGISLVGGLAVPAQRLGIVLHDAPAVPVQPADLVLREDVSLIGGGAVPAHRRGIVFAVERCLTFFNSVGDRNLRRQGRSRGASGCRGGRGCRDRCGCHGGCGYPCWRRNDRHGYVSPSRAAKPQPGRRNDRQDNDRAANCRAQVQRCRGWWRAWLARLVGGRGPRRALLRLLSWFRDGSRRGRPGRFGGLGRRHRSNSTWLASSRLRRNGGRSDADRFQLAHDALDRVFPVIEHIDPLPGRQLVGESFLGCHVFDPHGDHREVALAGQHELFLDFVRVVGIGREHQNHYLCGADRVHDRHLKVLARADVPAGNPATQTAIFQRLADRLRNGTVLRRVADEDRGAHGPRYRSRWSLSPQ